MLKANQKKRVDMSEWGDRFDYLGYQEHTAHCHIKVNGNAVICTESPDNFGTSITNMAEGIATQVCLRHGIPFDQLIWIEHYVNLSDTFGDENNGETFDLVTFDILEGSDVPYNEQLRLIHQGCRATKAFAHPKWLYATKEFALNIFNGKIKPEDLKNAKH